MELLVTVMCDLYRRPAEGVVVSLTTTFRCSFRGVCDPRLLELAALSAAADGSGAAGGEAASRAAAAAAAVVVPDTVAPVITILGQGVWGQDGAA